MSNSFSGIWKNKTKVKNRRKIIPLHYQKKSSSSSFHLSSFSHGGKKHELKTLSDNNIQLAIALEDARCELSVKEHQVQEYAKETFNNKLARIKVFEVTTNLRKMVADLDGALQLLGLKNTTEHLHFPKSNLNQHGKYKSKMETVIESEDESPKVDKDTTELEADYLMEEKSCESATTVIAADNLMLNMPSDMCEGKAVEQEKGLEETKDNRSSTSEPSDKIDGSPCTPKLNISTAMHLISLCKNSEESKTHAANEEKSIENIIVDTSLKEPKICRTSKIPRLRGLPTNVSYATQGEDKSRRMTFVVKPGGESKLPTNISHATEEEDKSRRMTFVVKPGGEYDKTNSKTARRKTFVVKTASTTISSDCNEQATYSLSSSEDEPMIEVSDPQEQKDLNLISKAKSFKLVSENRVFCKEMRNMQISDKGTLSCKDCSCNNENAINLSHTNIEKDATNVVKSHKDQGTTIIPAQKSEAEANDILDAIVEKSSQNSATRPRRKSHIKSYEMFFSSNDPLDLYSATEVEPEMQWVAEKCKQKKSIQRNSSIGGKNVSKLDRKRKKSVSKLDQKRKIKNQRFSNKGKIKIVISDDDLVSLNTNDNTNPNTMSNQAIVNSSESTAEYHEQNEMGDATLTENDCVSNKNKSLQLTKTEAQVVLPDHDSKSVDDNVSDVACNQTVISFIPTAVKDKCFAAKEINEAASIKNSYISNPEETKDFSDKITDSDLISDFPSKGKKAKYISFDACAVIIDVNRSPTLHSHENDEGNVREQDSNTYFKDTLDGCDTYADSTHCSVKLEDVSQKNRKKGNGLENSDDLNIVNSVDKPKESYNGNCLVIKERKSRKISKRKVKNKMQQHTSKGEILFDKNEVSPKKSKTEKKGNANNVEKCIDNVCDIVSINEIKSLTCISQKLEDFQIKPFDDNLIHSRETNKCSSEKADSDLSSDILSGRNAELLRSERLVSNFTENCDSYLKVTGNLKKKKRKTKGSVYDNCAKNTIVVQAEIHNHPASENEIIENNLKNLQPSVILNDVFNTKNNCINFCCENNLTLHENISKRSSKSPLSCNTFNVPSTSCSMHIEEILPENSDLQHVKENESNKGRSKSKCVSYKEPSLRRKMRR